MSKLDRRGFLGTAVAAIAGAATLAGGKTAEAAPRSRGCPVCQVNVVDYKAHVAEYHPVGQLTPAACPERGEIGATELMRRTHALYTHSDVARQAFAEGYERAEFVQAKREESRASIGNAQGDTLMVVGSTTIVGNLNVPEPPYGGVTTNAKFMPSGMSAEDYAPLTRPT